MCSRYLNGLQLTDCISVLFRQLVYCQVSVSTFTLILIFLIRKLVSLFLQEDLYYPHPLVQDILWSSLHMAVEPILMRWPGKKLREKALKTAIEHIHYEDENTRYLCIGPVNKVCIQAEW